MKKEIGKEKEGKEWKDCPRKKEKKRSRKEIEKKIDRE